MRFIAIWIILTLFTIPLQASRLLVNIEQTASFTPEEFADAASAKLLYIDPRNPYKTFESAFLDNAFVVISCPLNKRQLHILACRYGYRYAILGNESLERSVGQARTLLEANPKTSSDIPHLSLEESTSVYRLMEKIDRVFTANRLLYWAGGGTLLGAVRHGGLVPWDDDLDLYILEVDEEKLNQMESDLEKEGLVLHYYWKDLYKIFEVGALPIPDEEKPGQTLPFGYPAADVFLMALEKRNELQEIYVHRSYDFYWHWNNDRFTYPQIENISRIAFGPLTIPIPGDPTAYLDRLYGYNWKKYAVEPSWNHKTEDRTEYPGAAIVEIDDFSPAYWK
ncbi:MAG: LicD family protein [Chlamydiota bacterium]